MMVLRSTRAAVAAEDSVAGDEAAVAQVARERRLPAVAQRGNAEPFGERARSARRRVAVDGDDREASVSSRTETDDRDGDRQGQEGSWHA
jgi:hypothetical protein